MARDNLYSKTVIWVKVTLPIVALALMSTLFLFATTPDPDAALPYAEVDIDQITREQRVTQPHFASVLDEGRELILVADGAAIDNQRTNEIHAVMINGRMDLSDTAYLTLQSDVGDFDMAAQIATLQDDVTVTSTQGYQLESDALEVAMNGINLHAPDPVRITGPGLELTADRMDVTDEQGALFLRFTGSVRMLYDPQSE